MNDKVFFALYFSAFVLYNICFSFYGPLIPYFAEATGQSEGAFSILLVMRGVGFTLGGAIKLCFMKAIDLHKGLGLGCVVAGVGSLLLTLNFHRLWIGSASFFIAIGIFMIDVFGNISVINRSKERKRSSCRLVTPSWESATCLAGSSSV